jgi:homoserine O-acetyltransferase
MQFRMVFLLPLMLLGACQSIPTNAVEFPAPKLADYILKDFHFRSGEMMDVRMHVRTLGTLRQAGDKSNAVLILHGTGGNGDRFLLPQFGGILFGRGRLLDAEKYFIIIPDDVGHGLSTKPSDGLRAKFPNYGYEDMVELEYRLVTEALGVRHLRLVMGTSMGGMHSWLWPERYPGFMDAAMPLASLPGPISGRNRVWRKTIIDAIRNDPEWQGGNYAQQPQSLRTDLAISFFMAENPYRRYTDAPTLKQADAVLEKYINDRMATTDANDEIYALQASEDYDPSPDLEKIKCRLLAVNFADDLINPNDVEGILQTNIKRVKNGKAVVFPESDQTHGHQTHTYPVVWQRLLAELLRETER